MLRYVALITVLFVCLCGVSVAQTATPTPTRTPTPTPTNTPTYRGSPDVVDNNTYVSRVSTTGTLNLKVGCVAGSASSEYGVEILEVRVHLNAIGTTQTLTLSIENSTSSAHNTVLASQSMVSATDYVWRPAPCAVLGRDDVLRLYYGNAANKTVGASILWRKR